MKVSARSDYRPIATWRARGLPLSAANRHELRARDEGQRPPNAACPANPNPKLNPHPNTNPAKVNGHLLLLDLRGNQLDDEAGHALAAYLGR